MTKHQPNEPQVQGSRVEIKAEGHDAAAEQAASKPPRLGAVTRLASPSVHENKSAEQRQEEALVEVLHSVLNGARPRDTPQPSFLSSSMDMVKAHVYQNVDGKRESFIVTSETSHDIDGHARDSMMRVLANQNELITRNKGEQNKDLKPS